MTTHAGTDETSGDTPGAEPLRPMLGIVFMVLACALVAATTLFAKALGQGIGAGSAGSAFHPLQVSAGRFLFAWCALVPIVLWFRPSFRNARLGAHLARSLCGWAGVTCLFAAAAVMRLADATAISFLNPIFAMVLAIPLLSERVGPWRWAAAAVAFTGAMILIRPGSDAFQPMVLVALASAFFLGLEAIMIKQLTRGEPPLRILAINNTIGMLIAVTAASFVWVWPTPAQWAMMASLGGIMVCAQACFIQAMRNGDAGLVMPVFYATLLFAALYDFAIFGVVPPETSFLGAALIVASALTLAWRERRRSSR
jgi:drug/metabolite transporter (DMT)-like permease